ncbi:transcriptional regulator [Novosphingobium sp. AP12]|nr:transcriptional regulator [Novosphingobium sp. AP12]
MTKLGPAPKSRESRNRSALRGGPGFASQGKYVLQRDAAVPLYHQIYLMLRDEILSGQRPYGSAMPTEAEVSEIYSVSRITARRVLNDLADQNYVERKRRLGTRVVFRSPAKPLEANIDQAVDSLLALGQGTTVNVISVERREATATVASALQLAVGADVIRAVRVRCLDGVPIGYVVSYVPGELEAIVNESSLVRAPILTLLDEAGFRAKHAEQTIGAMQADVLCVERLHVEPLSAILRITRTVYDAEDKPFLRTYAHYRSDRFNIRMDLQNPGTD